MQVAVVLVIQRGNKRRQTNTMPKSIEPNTLLKESATCRHFLEVQLLTNFRLAIRNLEERQGRLQQIPLVKLKGRLCTHSLMAAKRPP